jgi:hypothetical protein
MSVTQRDQFLPAPAVAGPAIPGHGDFEFFVGDWDGKQRRLRKALAGCTEWEELTSITRCWSVFGGAANADEVHFTELGVSGYTMRLLDVATGLWSIYWISSRDGLLGLPPVVGGFTDGVGQFYCEQDWEGTPITCRYTWTHSTPDTAHWEQAFSTDGRQTWEPNWTADFIRRP